MRRNRDLTVQYHPTLDDFRSIVFEVIEGCMYQPDSVSVHETETTLEARFERAGSEYSFSMARGFYWTEERFYREVWRWVEQALHFLREAREA